jgi:heat shock protein HtpX
MWELIRANKRKSILLFIFMGSILILLGYVIGEAYFPGKGGYNGIFIALIIWVIWSMIGYFNGSSILLSLSRAKEVTHNIHPQLFNVVSEMKIAANLPAMPKIYIINEEAPNAFATGRKPEKSAIAVTAGLLNRLNRNELQGVIAHEMSHILNRDILYMTFAGVMLGTVVMISQIFLRGLWYSGGSTARYRSKRSNKNGGGAIMIIAIVLAILAPILTRLFYFAISRKREYLADATATRLTRYPEGLASALEKISSSNIKFSTANNITAPMYIVNPLKKTGRSLTGLFSTHPPIKERIKILRNMSHGVNYNNYQSAFRMVTGKGIIPTSGLKDSKNIPVKEPSKDTSKQLSVKEKKREFGDLIRAVNGFVFLTCVCGLKIKLPPNFKKPEISCPRCKRTIQMPLAKIAAVASAVSAGEAIIETPTLKPQKYIRKGKIWETITCSCGNYIQISPSFMGSKIQCKKCNKVIKIVNS